MRLDIARAITGFARRMSMMLVITFMLVLALASSLLSTSAAQAQSPGAPSDAATSQVAEAETARSQTPSVTTAASSPVDPIAGTPTGTKFKGVLKGTNLQVPYNGDVPANSFCSPDGRQALLNYRVNGGDSVAFVFVIFQKTATSSDGFFLRKDAPSDACLVTAIKYALEAGLKPAIKPHLEFQQKLKCNGTESTWRYHIHPKDQAKWWAEWTKWLLRYSRIAQANKAYAVFVGTEQGGQFIYKTGDDCGFKYDKNNPGRAATMVKTLRKAAPDVKYTYSANRKGEALLHSRTFTDSLDNFGVNLYPELDLKGAKPGPAAYAKALQSYKKDYLDKVYERYGKRKFNIGEWGWRSKKGTYKKAADASKDGVVDEQEQSDLYKVTLDFYEDIPYLAGIWGWRTETDPSGGGGNTNTFTVQGKKAEATQASSFGGSTAQKVSWIYPLNNAMLTGTQASIKVRLSDTVIDVKTKKSTLKWPAGTYTVEYRFYTRAWTEMTMVGGKHPYAGATANPSTLTKGSHTLMVRARAKDKTGKPGKVIALSAVTIKH